MDVNSYTFRRLVLLNQSFNPCFLVLATDKIFVRFFSCNFMPIFINLNVLFNLSEIILFYEIFMSVYFSIFENLYKISQMLICLVCDIPRDTWKFHTPCIYKKSLFILLKSTRVVLSTFVTNVIVSCKYQ